MIKKTSSIDNCVNDNIPIKPIFKQIATNYAHYRSRNLLRNEITKKNLALTTIYNNSNLILTEKEKGKNKEKNSKKKPTLKYIRHKHNKSVQMKPISKLKEKINFGSLMYLSMKEQERSKNMRHFVYQKEILLNSPNFKIGKDEHISIMPTQYNNNNNNNQQQRLVSPISSSKLFNSKSKKNLSPILNNKKQKKIETKKKPSIIVPPFKLENKLKHNNSNNILINNLTASTNYSGLSSSRLNSNNNNINNENKALTFRKVFRNNLNIHIDELNSKREQNQKRLFKLIDSCTRRFENKKKKLNKHLKKDIEEILEVKITEKQSNIKKDYLQAVNTKDGKSTEMSSTKVKMINFSDTINKFTDEEALKYAEKIAADYINSTKEMGLNTIRFENGKQFDYEGIEKRIQTTEIMRQKLVEKTKKMVQMRMKLDQEHLQMFKQLNNALQKEEQINKGEILRAQIAHKQHIEKVNYPSVIYYNNFKNHNKKNSANQYNFPTRLYSC